jgi:ABC-type nitrate/sulfonate/bicarbonate transport system substrate-binding protein
MPGLTTFFIAALLVLASLGRIACAKPNPDKITLGTITLSLNKLPIYVAQDKGFSPVRISSCNH